MKYEYQIAGKVYRGRCPACDPPGFFSGDCVHLEVDPETDTTQVERDRVNPPRTNKPDYESGLYDHEGV